MSIVNNSSDQIIKHQISVIIPCRNEEKYIAACLDSVLNNDYPHDYLEVLVIDGKSNDNTCKIVEKYTEKFNFIHLLINENNTVPFAMNLGINKSRGEYIIRLDAHSKIPANYFSQLIDWSIKLNADNVGACWITDVKNKNPKTNSIKAVLSNKFGIGNSYFRTGIDEVKIVDTVPFGCYRKEVFSKIGLYDNRLTRDQDIELNKRLKRNGGKIFLIPNLSSTYFARETFRGIAKNNFQTGLWNILTVYLTKRISSLSVRHFIPLIFLLSLILPLILIIWYPIIGLVAAISFLSYILVLMSVSIKINNNTTTWYYILYSFLVLHFSYGSGSLSGLFRLKYLFKKDK